MEIENMLSRENESRKVKNQRTKVVKLKPRKTKTPLSVITN